MKRILLLLALACWLSCRAPRPALAPGAGPSFRVMSLKFSYREAGECQNGRVACRFDDAAAKFVFFTPLNQAGLELDVAGEKARLLNFSERTYWQGDFSLLLDRLWGIGLTLAELKSLLLDPGAPPPRLAEAGIAVEKEEGAGGPRALRLRREGAELSLRVTKSEARPGRVILVDYSGRFRAGELEAVLGR
ncbi:MAG TPA: hypothetical protein PK919_07405 [Candidatus Aminicenantes bacterium]|nr:hypothetical protein [Candidatus Aminicenantes bacterium]